MLIKEDYSYISKTDRKLIDNGYGVITVKSIKFDRYFTEEQKTANLNEAKSMSAIEWEYSCDELSKKLEESMKKILDFFNDKYDIHQTSEEKSTLLHYKTDWDLFFWCNTCNKYMDFFRLEFNDKRSVEQNEKLLKEITKTVELLAYSNIYCRVQYCVVYDKKQLIDKAHEICETLQNKFINYNGMTGKIKPLKYSISELNYGFFEKNSKKRYYMLDMKQLVTMYI